MLALRLLLNALSALLMGHGKICIYGGGEKGARGSTSAETGPVLGEMTGGPKLAFSETSPRERSLRQQTMMVEAHYTAALPRTVGQ